MAKQSPIPEENDSFSLTSMIDVVFLLLIYFMYLPIQQEADISLVLPVDSKSKEKVALPSEQIINIAPDGTVFLNDSLYGAAEDKNLRNLTTALTRLKLSADRSGVQTVVTVIPDGDAPHQAAMSVLNACTKANISAVSFSKAL